MGKSVSSLEINKSSGEDGLTKDFFDHFWVNLADLIQKFLDECESSCDLCDSQGLVRISYKKLERTKNLRPYHPPECRPENSKTRCKGITNFALAHSRVNKDKIVGLSVGTLRGEPLNFAGIKWVEEPVKSVGVGNNRTECNVKVKEKIKTKLAF